MGMIHYYSIAGADYWKEFTTYYICHFQNT
jgi:hypothetical protein